VSASDSVEADILAVVDAVGRRASARGERIRALNSVRDLVANDEAEIAIDHLVNAANAFRLPLRADEHERLMAAATRLDYADAVTDIDPRLLLPAGDE
jgi:basic amino acid/polyamine antiporter, APA family